MKSTSGVAQPERRDVGAQGVQAVGTELDEIDTSGAAREGLDADRSGSREELEHPRIGQIIVHDVEHGCADVLSRGPDAPVLGRHQIAAGELSGYDSHELPGARMHETVACAVLCKNLLVGTWMLHSDKPPLLLVYDDPVVLLRLPLELESALTHPIT